MNTVPGHLYKTVVAEEIVRRNIMPWDSLAYQLIAKYQTIFQACVADDSDYATCVDKLADAWAETKRNVSVTRLSPTDPRICKRIVKIK